MVAGHLQEKKGLYYIVLSYLDELENRKTKWIPTGLLTNGNKKRAEAMIMEQRRSFDPENKPVDGDILFADYMEKWLEIIKSSIQKTTYSSYSNMVKGVIAPYFRKRNITLGNLQVSDIQDFYTEQLKRVKASSIIHYHANIHKVLRYAFKTDLIPQNPADKIERSKKNASRGAFTTAKKSINSWSCLSYSVLFTDCVAVRLLD